MQLEAYRDQYATMFHNGRNVVVLSVSTDADTTLAAWAREKDFPLLFGSDPEGTMARRYGAFNERAKLDVRYVYVIDPQGKIAYTAKPFRALTQDAYTDLAAAVDRVAPKRSAEDAKP